MNIGYAQFEPVFGGVSANLDAMTRLIKTVAADLLVLPELATSGYTFTSRDEAKGLAESFDDSPSLDRLQRLAAERDCAFVVGFPERDGDNLYNSAALLRPDGTRECYRKIHLYAAENDWFEPGGKPFEVHDVNGVAIGIMICFDWFFPESARSLALMGAQVICQPANLVLPWCQRAMVIRGVENHVFTVTANRVGEEARGPYRYLFTGGSQVTTPTGEVLVPAARSGEAAVSTAINPLLATDKRLNEWNDLFGDRRLTQYSGLCQGVSDDNKFHNSR